MANQVNPEIIANLCYLGKIRDVVGWEVAARQLLCEVSAGDEAGDLLGHPQQPRRQLLARSETLKVQHHVPDTSHLPPIQAAILPIS